MFISKKIMLLKFKYTFFIHDNSFISYTWIDVIRIRLIINQGQNSPGT